MPRRRRLTKAHVGGLLLDRDHDDEMDLQIGPGKRSAEDLERLRALWWAHRAELMAEAGPGSRPWAWWWLESGLEGPPPTPEDRHGFVTGEPAEEAWLRKHGFLTAWEERELAKWHRVLEGASAIDEPDLGDAS